MLGLYKADVHESYPDIEEPDHVVNATHGDGEDTLVMGSSRKAKAKKKKAEAKKKVDSSPQKLGEWCSICSGVHRWFGMRR